MVRSPDIERFRFAEVTRRDARCPFITTDRAGGDQTLRESARSTPSPRSSRGRDERSSLLEGWGEGPLRELTSIDRPVPPHPDCSAIRPLPASGARLERV